MGVIPVSTMLANLKAIGKFLLGLDALKTVKSRHTIHQARQKQPMPVNRAILMFQVIFDMNHRVIAFFKLKQWRRKLAIDTNPLHGFTREIDRTFINHQMIFFHGCKYGRRRHQRDAQTQVLGKFNQHNFILHLIKNLKNQDQALGGRKISCQ